MSQVMQSPRILSSGQGESFQMLSHTFTTKVTSADTNGEWAMYEVADTADHGAPLHTHPWEETFYILEGEIEMQVGNRTTVAGVGASVYLPANVAHAFKINSPTFRALILMPAYAEAFYRETGEKITTLPPNPEDFQEICAKHGVRLFL